MSLISVPASAFDTGQFFLAPGVEVSPESLFDARLKIVRETGFPESTTRKMHDLFFEGLTRREENRQD